MKEVPEFMKYRGQKLRTAVQPWQVVIEGQINGRPLRVTGRGDTHAEAQKRAHERWNGYRKLRIKHDVEDRGE